MSAGLLFLPRDRVAWYSPYSGRVYSGAVEVVATSERGDLARVRVEGSGEQEVVECDRLSLVPDPQPATVSTVLALVAMLAEVRATLEDAGANHTHALESIESALAELVTVAEVGQ